VTVRARQRDRAPITTGDPGATTGVARRLRPIPFGIHQLFEYFFAVALVVISVHIGGNTLLVIAGATLGLLALTARGPLGLIRLCGPRLHAVLDVTAGVVLAFSPLVRPLRPGVVGIVVLELVVVAWLRISMLTRYTVRPDPSGSAGGPDMSSSSASNDGPEIGNVSPGPTLSAIRGLGRLTAGARNRLPDARDRLPDARQMGAHAGRLQRAWRRTTR
jgi:hypothetical protein